VDGVVGSVATNDDESIDPSFLKGSTDGVQLTGAGHLAASAELGPALTGPSFNVLPGELSDVSLGQADESVTNAQHGVAPRNSQSGKGSGGRVHAGGWPAGMHDGDAFGVRTATEFGGGAGWLGQLGEDGIHLGE